MLSTGASAEVSILGQVLMTGISNQAQNTRTWGEGVCSTTALGVMSHNLAITQLKHPAGKGPGASLPRGPKKKMR